MSGTYPINIPLNNALCVKFRQQFVGETFIVDSTYFYIIPISTSSWVWCIFDFLAMPKLNYIIICTFWIENFKTKLNKISQKYGCKSLCATIRFKFKRTYFYPIFTSSWVWCIYNVPSNALCVCVCVCMVKVKEGDDGLYIWFTFPRPVLLPKYEIWKL